MSYDPIPAEGAGADRFDQPSLFYLTNQAIIDKWFGLRSNVAEAMGEWCRSVLRDALEQPAFDRGLRVAEARGPGNYHHITVYDPKTSVDDTQPVISIGLAWPSKTIDPTSGSMYVCVRNSRNEAGMLAAQMLLDAGGLAFRAADKRLKGKGDADWPVYRSFQPGEQWWTDLDSLRDRIVCEILEMADGLREPLAAVAAMQGVRGNTDDG